MPKLKKQSLKNNLEGFLTGYDSSSLVGVLNTLENNVAWEVFTAYAAKVQRQYEVDALDMTSKFGKDKEAAYASGYAKCAEDMQKDFMQGLKQTVLNVNPVIENVRTEE